MAQIKKGKWIRAHRFRVTKQNGRTVIEVQRTVKRKTRTNQSRRRNIAAGYYDEDGYFHPIRASYDYDKSRAGESSRKRK